MKSRILFTFITLIILFAINKSWLFADLKKQSSISKIINTAGKQRMYSQKITKLAFYIQQKTVTDYFNLEVTSLKKEIDSFNEAHEFLNKFHVEQYKNLALTDLFKEIEPYYSKIVNSSKDFIPNPKDEIAKANFIETVKLNEIEFLRIMDDIVYEYQLISEKKAASIKNRENTFNILIAFLLLFSLITVVFPLLKNKNL